VEITSYTQLLILPSTSGWQPSGSSWRSPATGVFSWIRFRKSIPDVGDTQVTVITLFPGRAATESRTADHRAAGASLKLGPRVLTAPSKRFLGSSVIQLTFEDGTGPIRQAAGASKKLGDAVLPDGVNPALGPLTGPVGEIFRYVIESTDEHTPMELRTLQDWVIIPRLLQVPGSPM